MVEPPNADLRKPAVEIHTGIPPFAAGHSEATFPSECQRSDEPPKSIGCRCYSGNGQEPAPFAEPFRCAAAAEMALRESRVYSRDRPSLEFIKSNV
jgi:hypothetical protein